MCVAFGSKGGGGEGEEGEEEEGEEEEGVGQKEYRGILLRTNIEAKWE